MGAASFVQLHQKLVGRGVGVEEPQQPHKVPRDSDVLGEAIGLLWSDASSLKGQIKRGGWDVMA